MLATDFGKQAFDASLVETFVSGIDEQKERIVGHTIKTWIGKHGIAELWQSVKRPHSEERTKRSQQNRQLERNRHESGQRDKRFA